MFQIEFTNEFYKWLEKLKKKNPGDFRYLYSCIRDLEFEGHRYTRAKSLGDGLFEIKTHLKYRIYYRFEGDFIILVLDGGDKDTQQRDIRRIKKGSAK